MNAAARDTFEPSGGSIKDRIIRSIHALGESATLAGLKKAVDCNSPLLLEMQLEGMQRRGEVYIAAGGNYALRGDLADTMLEREPKASPPPADPAPAPTQDRPSIDPPPTQEPSVKDEKLCPACDTTKPKKDFDKNQRRCKPCVKSCAGLKVNSDKPAPKKKTTKQAIAGLAKVAPVNGEFVIPASGAITCRMSGATAEIRQFDDLICCSIEQLQAIRDWATGQLKRAAS